MRAHCTVREEDEVVECCKELHSQRAHEITVAKLQSVIIGGELSQL